MKVVAFNGSPRKDGNTATLLREVQKELDGQGIETEIVHLKGPIQGCIACFKCYEKKDGKCALDKDIINDCIEKMAKADGIILALLHTSRTLLRSLRHLSIGLDL